MNPETKNIGEFLGKLINARNQERTRFMKDE